MNRIFEMARSLNREKAVKEGFYDGRFRSRVEPDKKKILHKEFRKNKCINVEY